MTLKVLRGKRIAERKIVCGGSGMESSGKMEKDLPGDYLSNRLLERFLIFLNEITVTCPGGHAIL